MLAFLLMALLSAPESSAQPATSREYQIKAAFLFNFAQFVEWPASAFVDAKSPLVIGVLGDDPFDHSLEETVRGETVGQRPFLVQHYRRAEDITTCHILFISASESNRMEAITAALKGRPILTVGDSDAFALHGGMIRFFMEKNKVRFRINLTAAKATGLTISSKLLRPAEVVTTARE